MALYDPEMEDRMLPNTGRLQTSLSDIVCQVHAYLEEKQFLDYVHSVIHGKKVVTVIFHEHAEAQEAMQDTFNECNEFGHGYYLVQVTFVLDAALLRKVTPIKMLEALEKYNCATEDYNTIVDIVLEQPLELPLLVRMNVQYNHHEFDFLRAAVADGNPNYLQPQFVNYALDAGQFPRWPKEVFVVDNGPKDTIAKRLQ